MKNVSKDLFATHRILLDKAITKLAQAHQVCLELKGDYSREEPFEVLTSRFARAADLYTQKLLGFLFRFLKEPDMTFIDKCHYLEKIGLLSAAAELFQIRDLRNQISHEYALDSLTKIHQDVMAMTPKLIELIGRTTEYIDQQLQGLEL